MTGTEPLYVYRQSQQISQQTGFVGYLRGDYGESGKQFFTSWFETGQLADRDRLSALCLNDMSSAITQD